MITQSYTTGQIKYSAEDDVANSLPIEIGNFRSGLVGGRSSMSFALQFWGCATRDGTYKRIEDSGSSDVSLDMTADRWTQIPAAVFSGLRFLKIVNSSQINVNLLFKS